LNLPNSFREYAVYCYKTNNTNALFSKTHIYFNYLNRGCREDVKPSVLRILQVNSKM